MNAGNAGARSKRTFLIAFIAACALLSRAAAAAPATAIPLTITFPDGREVRVTLRPEAPPSSTPKPPARKLMDVYARYRSSAMQGDTDAAVFLARGLNRCKSAFRTDEALANAMQKLRDEGVLALPDGTSMNMKLTPEQIAREEQTLREALEYCRGVGDGELASLPVMHEISAAGSGWVAASKWANSLGQTADGKAAWEYLWSQGYRQALTHLSAMSAKGNDGVRAYAYLLLNLRIAEAAQERAEAMFVNRLRTLIPNWTSALSIQQQAKAEDLAYEMLARNRACCFVFTPGGY